VGPWRDSPAARMAAERRHDANSGPDARATVAAAWMAPAAKGRMPAQAAGCHSGRDAREGSGGRMPPSSSWWGAIVPGSATRWVGFWIPGRQT